MARARGGQVRGDGPSEAGQRKQASAGSELEPERGPLVPRRMYLTTGVGVHDRYINASDLALRAAGIGECNRVRVSSMIPPGCRLVERAEGQKELRGGQILFAVLAPVTTAEPGQKIAAAIALAIPDDGGTGCIAEVTDEEGIGKTADEAIKQAQMMSLEMLALRLGVEFDPKKEYRKGKKTYRMGTTTVRAHQIAVEATGDTAQNRITNILAALVFLP